MADHDTSKEQEQLQAELRISNRISGVLLGTIVVLSALAIAAYAAFSGNTQTRGMPMMAATPTAQTVTVAMHDPGCHWFQVGNGLQKSLSITGPVNLLNRDEAALRITGASGSRTDGVGKQVKLAPGSYTITMVGQPPDDNTLHLSVS